MRAVVLVIKTKAEIFHSDVFPISFPDYIMLCRWLKRPDNHNLIEKIQEIKEVGSWLH